MAVEIKVSFPGNKRVDADFGEFVVNTDQTVKNGGEGSAPEPYSLFLASIATCAGYYVLAFCSKRDLPVDGIELVQTHVFSEKGHVLERVELEIKVPASFPERYRDALVKAAGTCGVKKAIAAQPAIEIGVTVGA